MIILDTHAWVWWASKPEQLSAKARRSIDEAQKIGVSAISCWEIATLVRKGRLELDRDVSTWLAVAASLPRLTVIPLDAAIAEKAGSLDSSFHGDPADRIIVITALENKAPLITKDEPITDSELVKCIW